MMKTRIHYKNMLLALLLILAGLAGAIAPQTAAGQVAFDLDPPELKVEAKGGQHKVTLSSEQIFTIKDVMLPSWMNRYPSLWHKSLGLFICTFTFDPNIGAERTANIVFKTDKGDVTLKVTQAGGAKASFTFDPPALKVEAKGGEHQVTLSSEHIFAIKEVTLPSWMSPHPSLWHKGPGLFIYTFTFDPNTGPERTADIVFKTDLGNVMLKVTQMGGTKVSSILLSRPQVTINGNLSQFVLTAFVSPANATNQRLQWSSSDESVATVHSANKADARLKAGPIEANAITAIIHKKGRTVITARAMDGSNVVAHCEVNVLSTVANTVPYAPQAKVYTVGPTLYLSLPTAETVQVYTLAGTLYRTWQAPAGDTSVILPAGTYIIKVGPLTEKVVVQ